MTKKQQSERQNANLELVETIQWLVEIYKREFGDYWAEAWNRTVSVQL